MEMLERPRRVLMMVPAGKPVDSVIAHLRPHLQEGDILIDGGNSLFTDTDRRSDDLAAAGFRFVGAGVSGGEEGALLGPAIMPGGPREAWDALAPIFRAIAAKADDGEPCVDYMGPRGAGHYVKMVHNGIEYGDMQLIAEVYDVLHRGARALAPRSWRQVFAEWNAGELRSYLVEITAQIFERVDEETGTPLVDMILDEAQQKGTGKWMSQNAFDIGAPIPTVNAAVEARILSSLKRERVAASTGAARSRRRAGRRSRPPHRRCPAGALCEQDHVRTRRAWRCCASPRTNTSTTSTRDAVAKIWRAGCIIRASLLGDIRQAFERDPGLVNLLLDAAFRDAIAERQEGWRHFVQTAIGLGIPVPAMARRSPTTIRTAARACRPT